MTAAERRRNDAGTTWLPGRRLAGLRCAVGRGHRWGSSPVVNGSVVLACSRCGELVWAAFVDQPAVLGLAEAHGRGLLGSASASRTAVDLVAAVLAKDTAAWRRLRREAVARPGEAVDALATLAGYLSALADGERPLELVHLIAAHSELATVENAMHDEERSPR